MNKEMTGYVIVKTYPCTKERFIARHNFYYDEAKNRLLSSFYNINEDAANYAETWLEMRSQSYDKDSYDATSDLAEAEEKKADYCVSLHEMSNDVRLTILTIIYQKWEKDITSHLKSECGRLNANVEKINMNFDNIKELLKEISWDIEAEGFYVNLNTCRLLVNSFKHGTGSSFNKLQEESGNKYITPFFMYDQAAGCNNVNTLDIVKNTASPSDIFITEDHLNQFSQSIVDFWKRMPEDLSFTKQ